MAYAAGQKLRASALNTPVFHGYANTAQSIANATWVEVLLPVEFLDNIGGHSTSTNTARYTPNRAGYYKVFGQVAYAANATGYRFAQVRKNALQIDQAMRTCVQAAPTFESSVQCSGIIQLNGVADYISMWAFQGSGGALNTAYALGNEGSYLIAELLGAL